MIQLLMTAIYNALRNDTGVQAQVGNPARVRRRFVKQGTVLPFIRFYLSGGGYENIVEGDYINVTVRVEAVAETLDAASLAYQAAENVLHRDQTTVVMTGWHIFWLFVEDVYERDFLEDGKQFFAVGGELRIRASED